MTSPAPSAASGTFVPPAPLSTAVLFLVFNRPDVTAQVFEAIRQARPPRLYVAADGPRSSRPAEAEKCAEVRRIASQVDWPCQVKTLFRQENQGCKRAVSGAISWFFEQEAEGIILEDDCLPAQSFFWFCEEILAKYRDDQRVWQVCGTAFVMDLLNGGRPASYIFSKYGPIWGWASWRRAWDQYDPDLSQWPQMSQALSLNSVYEDAAERRARLVLGGKLFRNEIDTWDFQWGFAKNYQSGLSVVPCRNLIVNIGFGPEATHSTEANPYAPARKVDIAIPLEHPPFVVADAEHDRLYGKKLVVGAGQGPLKKVVSRAMKLIQKKRASS